MKNLLSILLSVWLFGCTSDVANRVYVSSYPPRPEKEVEILAKPPERPYIVIADFQSRGETSSDMQKRAAKLGADAVIVVHLGGYRSHGDDWAGEDSEHRTYSRIAGTAIKYK